MIEAALRRGTPFRKVVKRYGTSVATLHRHKSHWREMQANGASGVRNVPTPMQAEFLAGVREGKSMRAAALAAGYSEKVANQASRKIVPGIRARFEQVLNQRFDAGEYVDVIMDGLKAENTQFFSHEGIVTDERKTIAWRERHRYADLLGDLIGAKVGRQQFEGPDGGPVQCQVAVVHVGSFQGKTEPQTIDVKSE